MPRRDGPKVTLGLVQMSMTSDTSRNLEKAMKMVDDAARGGADIVCLPELFNSIYFPQRRAAHPYSEEIPGPTTEALSNAARENEVVLVGGSICEKDGKKLYNTSVVFDQRGKVLGKYRKIHIPQDPDFYEQDYFSSGGRYAVFDTSHGTLGTLICFDQWYPEPARINRLMGAKMIFYPTAIGRVKGTREVEGDWQEAWEAVQRGHAISNSVVVCSVNRVGIEGEMNFWGGSFVSDQFGKILARADDRERVLIVDCSLELGKMIEDGWGFLRNRKPPTYGKIQE